jgi:hypothetical protein
MTIEIFGMRERGHQEYFSHNSTLVLRAFDTLATKNLKKAIRKRNARQEMPDNAKFTKIERAIRTRERMTTITLFECSFLLEGIHLIACLNTLC